MGLCLSASVKMQIKDFIFQNDRLGNCQRQIHNECSFQQQCFNDLQAFFYNQDTPKNVRTHSTISYVAIKETPASISYWMRTENNNNSVFGEFAKPQREKRLNFTFLLWQTHYLTQTFIGFEYVITLG